MSEDVADIAARTELYLQIRAALQMLAPDVDDELVDEIAELMVGNLCR